MNKAKVTLERTLRAIKRVRPAKSSNRSCARSTVASIVARASKSFPAFDVMTLGAFVAQLALVRICMARRAGRGFSEFDGTVRVRP